MSRASQGSERFWPGQGFGQAGTIEPLADAREGEVLGRRAPEPLHQVCSGVDLCNVVSQDRQRIAGLDAFQEKRALSQIGIEEDNGALTAESAKCRFLAEELVVDEAKLDDRWSTVGSAHRADVIREGVGEGRLETELPALSDACAMLGSRCSQFLPASLLIRSWFCASRSGI